MALIASFSVPARMDFSAAPTAFGTFSSMTGSLMLTVQRLSAGDGSGGGFGQGQPGRALEKTGCIKPRYPP